MQMPACYVCGKPATAFYNTAIACASSVPDHLEPVCDEHNPMALIVTVKHKPARPASVTYPTGSCGEYVDAEE